MTVNIWFNVSAVFLLMILLNVLIIRRMPGLLRNKLFAFTYTFVFISTVADLCRSLIQNFWLGGLRCAFVSPAVATAIMTVYYCSQICACIFTVIYVYSVFGISTLRPTQQLLLVLPVVPVLAVLVLNVRNANIFYYDENCVYHNGRFIWFYYAALLYYLVFVLGKLVRYGSILPKYTRSVLIALVLFVCSGNFLQSFFVEMRLVNFVNAMVAIMVYLIVERPSDFVDSATGLQNRTLFYLTVEANLKRRHPMEFILVSIGNISALDNEIASSAIDDLLTSASHFLRGISRNVSVYRIDRSNFMLSLKDCGEFDADGICSTVLARFREPFESSSYCLVLKASCCRISSLNNFETSEELNALIKLASQEAARLNAEIIHAGDLDIEEYSRNIKLDRQLKTVLEDGAFEIRYQPVWNVKTASIDSIETCVSINTPELGIVPEKKFIPMAEENGTMQRIFFYLLHTVCGFIRQAELDKKGIRTVEFILPVSELLKTNICQIITDIVDIYYIPHEMIRFTLLEEILYSYEVRTAQNLKMLKENGFSISLNNYGCGYTNAGTIIQMPLDCVNLDRRITQAAFRSNKADTLFLCTIDMLKKLKLGIKVRHIESDEQKDYAAKLGCDFLEGYYFSAPLRDGDVLDFLKGVQDD